MGIGISLAGLVFWSFGCAEGELYFPAGKDSNLRSRIERDIESQKGNDEKVYVGLQGVVYEYEN